MRLVFEQGWLSDSLVDRASVDIQAEKAREIFSKLANRSKKHICFDYYTPQDLCDLFYLIRRKIKPEDTGITLRNVEDLAKQMYLGEIQCLLRLIQEAFYPSPDDVLIFGVDKIVIHYLREIWQMVEILSEEGLSYAEIGIHPRQLKQLRLKSYTLKAMAYLRRARNCFVTRSNLLWISSCIRQYKEWAKRAGEALEEPAEEAELSCLNLVSAQFALNALRLHVLWHDTRVFLDTLNEVIEDTGVTLKNIGSCWFELLILNILSLIVSHLISWCWPNPFNQIIDSIIEEDSKHPDIFGPIYFQEVLEFEQKAGI